MRSGARILEKRSTSSVVGTQAEVVADRANGEAELLERAADAEPGMPRRVILVKSSEGRYESYSIFSSGA